ncbi:LysR family transcriptional regulator [Pseudomonas sp. 21LCFQ02]|uniref:LysR family transcriptional regulator n=1 Tax=unclassified Pseudomonas TaxID=196821 RepID=UPI00209AD120|nr:MULTISPECIES: LysR family transcriptional regulator [unclassified Pseudomonas]MCO8168577.1 LysR family transcriptional regulator [Pseudomonas sp. 21LCFQ02]MCO8169682.1 LysR family transcriptional regulator [Pseudomonas sp. 21LCFQ02]MCQ9425369.1 LysR family transcriptional regulator [Pseudomonas sp. LJDD11]
MIAPLTSLISRLRLKQLRLLIALDDHGSLHKAAEYVAITQPGATSALNEIESAFGTRLFTRTSQGLEANDLGRCVIRYARLIHSDMAHLREELIGILQGQGGRIAVGAVMGAVPLLVSSLARLREAQPELAVEVVEDTSARLLGLIDQGRLDLALCRTSVSQRPQAYDCLPLAPEALQLVANPLHPLAAAASLTLDELQHYNWVVYPANMPMRLVLEREFSEAGLEFPRFAIETASTFTTLMLLQQDRQLVAMMPKAVAESASGMGVVPLALTLRSRSEPFWLVSRHNTPLSAPARLLTEALQAGVGSVDGA